MGNVNPIIPPGSALQRTIPGRNPRLFVSVCAVLAVHVVVLAGLLIQGCKREDKNAGQESLPDLRAAQSNAATPAEELAKIPPAPSAATVQPNPSPASASPDRK